MKTPLLWFLGLMLCVQAFGQPVLRQATDAEATAGTDVHAYINPRQLAANAGVGPTNGLGSNQVAQVAQAVATNSYIANNAGPGTNNILKTPTISGGTVTNASILNSVIASNSVIALQPPSGSAGRVLSHNDLAAGDMFLITHNGGEFFVGITNGSTIRSFLDLNLAGEFEFNITTGNFYRFYTDNGGVDTVRWQIGDNGATGNGAGVTNLPIIHALTAGANMSMSYSRDAANGGSNVTASVADPMSLNTINAVNVTTTNYYTATNGMGGITVIDLATGSETTVILSGNLTISGFQNAVAGVYNEKIVHILPGGSDRTISVPASWKLGRFNTGVVTNNTCGDFLFSMQSGFFTNWFQLDAK